MNRRSFFGFALAPLVGKAPAPIEKRDFDEYPCNNHDHCRRCGGCGHNTDRCPGIVRCKLCQQEGHEATVGQIRPKQRNDYDWGQYQSVTAWCPNAPVNWDVYEQVPPRAGYANHCSRS